jgi:hypothetical protein
MCIVIGVLCVIAAFLPQAQPAAVPVCLMLVPLLAAAFGAAVPLALFGEDDAPIAPLIAGWTLIVGGTICDVVATAVHSPDLTREANPVIRGLLDNDVSLVQVYVYGAVMQVLFVGLSMALWLGFLKHRHTLAATMPPHGSLLAYLKAGTGARELSYRQWVCPLRYSELPWAYHLAWWAGIGFVATSAYRFYLAVEWYGIAPLEPMWVRLIAPSIVLLATCWAYASWLRRAKRRHHAHDRPLLPAAQNLPAD